MTVTIVGNITSGPVGPGYIIVAHTDVIGPLANDDTVTVGFEPTFPLIGGVSGSVQIFGSRTRGVTLGLGRVNIAANMSDHLNSSSTGSLQIDWAHANGTIYDTGTFSGFTWDGTGGIWALIINILTGGGNSAFGDLLTAVQKTYQNAP